MCQKGALVSEDEFPKRAVRERLGDAKKETEETARDWVSSDGGSGSISSTENCKVFL